MPLIIEYSSEKIKELEDENNLLRSTLSDAMEHLSFTLGCTNSLLRPDKNLIKNLDPTFYHTNTYEGDLELLTKAYSAYIFLDKYIKQNS